VAIRFLFRYRRAHHLPNFGDKAAMTASRAEKALYVTARNPDGPDIAAMARHDFQTPRLYLAQPLLAGVSLPLDAARTHYLTHVLRLKAGDPVLVFNGTDGEWKGHLAAASTGKGGARRQPAIALEAKTRPQTASGNLHYLFSPLKRARLDYMVQKAVEMGVSRLQPVMMRRTQAERVNLDRMAANAIEAAEQCGILVLPEIMAPVDLPAALAALAPARHLVFCDEEAPLADPVAALRASGAGGAGIAVLIGPEGGFADEERTLLLARAQTSRIALGPRILRADTAAIAALAIVQAAAGDWRSPISA